MLWLIIRADPWACPREQTRTVKSASGCQAPYQLTTLLQPYAAVTRSGYRTEQGWVRARDLGIDDPVAGGTSTQAVPRPLQRRHNDVDTARPKTGGRCSPPAPCVFRGAVVSDSPRECLGISNRGRIACSSCKLMLVSLPLSVLLTSPLPNCTSEGSSPGHLYLPLPSPLVIGARSAFPDAGLGVAPMSTHNGIPGSQHRFGCFVPLQLEKPVAATHSDLDRGFVCWLR